MSVAVRTNVTPAPVGVRKGGSTADMDLDLRHVRYFVAVADELHFGRAAAKLFISQPALSKQIRKLEEQIGATLLIRDSRHVALTPRGAAFLVDARELLALAERMYARPDAGTVRIAHVFELSTSREVADAYGRSRPDAALVQRAMDSVSQLDALLDDRLDVAVLRLTPQMLREHPRGWSHTLLRLEPLRLVGRPGDPPRAVVSMTERPIEVFGDTPDSGLYNAHGNYLTALEQHTGRGLRWLGTPGAFSHCLASLHRAKGSAFLLEFDSYAVRYAEAGLPVHRPTELQPHYPWSIAWRDGQLPPATADFLECAHNTATKLDWRSFDTHTDAPPWLPVDDPVAQELGL